MFALEKSYLKVFLVLLIVNLLTPLSYLLLRKNLPPEVPILYGLSGGENELTPTYGLAFPGLSALVLTLVNTAVVGLSKNTFLKQLLVFTSIAITVFSLVATYKVISLVGSF
jgi:hypothetical protein